MGGWADPNPRFAFYYYLQYPDDNTLIVQRGRFSKWNKETISEFFDRIKGI
jgi:inner membrane protein